MASKNIVEIIIKATDKASKKMRGLNSVVGKLGIAAGIAGAAVLASGVIIGKAVYNMTKEAARVEKLKATFDSLADSILQLTLIGALPATSDADPMAVERRGPRRRNGLCRCI